MMECKHDKREESYIYEFNGEEIHLCADCERDLLIEMKKQEVLENKGFFPEMERNKNPDKVPLKEVDINDKKMTHKEAKKKLKEIEGTP